MPGYGKNKHFNACSYDTETTRTRDHTPYNMNFHVPNITQQQQHWTIINTSYQKLPFGSGDEHWTLLLSTAGTQMAQAVRRKLWLRYNRTTATIAQHVPPLRAQLGDVAPTLREKRLHRDAERSRRVESIVSAPYLGKLKLRLTATAVHQYEHTGILLTAGSQTSSATPDDGSHPPHRPFPMP